MCLALILHQGKESRAIPNLDFDGIASASGIRPITDQANPNSRSPGASRYKLLV